MKPLKEHLVKIGNDISELYALYHVYNSFVTHFYTDEYHKNIGGEAFNILIFIRNSLLHSFLSYYADCLALAEERAAWQIIINQHMM